MQGVPDPGAADALVRIVEAHPLAVLVLGMFFTLAILNHGLASFSKVADLVRTRKWRKAFTDAVAYGGDEDLRDLDAEARPAGTERRRFVACDLSGVVESQRMIAQTQSQIAARLEAVGTELVKAAVLREQSTEILSRISSDLWKAKDAVERTVRDELRHLRPVYPSSKGGP